MLEVPEDLPVPPVECAVGDAQKLGRAFHVHLLVADGLKCDVCENGAFRERNLQLGFGFILLIARP